MDAHRSPRAQQAMKSTPGRPYMLADQYMDSLARDCLAPASPAMAVQSLTSSELRRILTRRRILFMPSDGHRELVHLCMAHGVGTMTHEDVAQISTSSPRTSISSPAETVINVRQYSLRHSASSAQQSSSVTSQDTVSDVGSPSLMVESAPPTAAVLAGELSAADGETPLSPYRKPKRMSKDVDGPAPPLRAVTRPSVRRQLVLEPDREESPWACLGHALCGLTHLLTSKREDLLRKRLSGLHLATP